MNVESFDAVRKFFIFFLVGIISILLQSISISLLGTFAPNLLVIPVLYLCFFDVSYSGAVLCFMFGIIFDLSNGTVLGPSAGAFILLYSVISIISYYIFDGSTVSILIAVLLGTLLFGTVFNIINFQVSSYFVREWYAILIESVITAAIAPWIINFLRRQLNRGKHF